MQIRILAVGSTPEERARRHWGVAFLIGEDVLFDTFGDPAFFLQSLQSPGIIPERIRHVIISHDDWDHISGLWDFLAKYPDVTVYIGAHAAGEIKDRLKALGTPCVEVSGWTCLKPGVFSSGELEASGGGMHEQVLVLPSSERTVVVTGCAHPGITKIVEHVQQTYPGPMVVLGGLHLKDTAQDEAARVAQQLKDLGVVRVAPTHCTGAAAVEDMRRVFGPGCLDVVEGAQMEL